MRMQNLLVNCRHLITVIFKQKLSEIKMIEIKLKLLYNYKIQKKLKFKYKTLIELNIDDDIPASFNRTIQN
jgi:uncharacterized protein YqgQ